MDECQKKRVGVREWTGKNSRDNRKEENQKDFDDLDQVGGVVDRDDLNHWEMELGGSLKQAYFIKNGLKQAKMAELQQIPMKIVRSMPTLVRMMKTKKYLWFLAPTQLFTQAARTQLINESQTPRIMTTTMVVINHDASLADVTVLRPRRLPNLAIRANVALDFLVVK